RSFMAGRCLADEVDCPAGYAFRDGACYPRSRAVALRTTGQVFTPMGGFLAFVAAGVARSTYLANEDFSLMAALSAAAPIVGHATGAFVLGATLWAVGAKTASQIPEP